MDIQAQLDELAQRVGNLSADNKATNAPASTPASTPVAPSEPPTLQVARPQQNVITMTIGGQTVALGPNDISEMIDQLAQARATMTPEIPLQVVPGKSFAATKDPVIAAQTVAQGNKLMLLRHTGFGWVPFTCSPQWLAEMLAVLSRK
ncbi:Phage tail protein [Pararobbsia alpina]|jgi:hypothetical protein|uniref:hypothetical protein n=1 Tax=Pararobbsia alpina TaxID=621374 RepID=UPI0039A6FD9F